MKLKFLLTLVCLVVSVGCFAGDKTKTMVVSQDNAKTENFDWGSLITYYAGETYSIKDSLTAVAIIKPGMEIHPPHTHAEEEYLMIIEGEGTWTIKDKDTKASAGDILYAAPWELHGLKNTGKTPMKFVVWKWNGKGVVLPAAKK